MRAQSPAHLRCDRAWVNRLLEVTTASLQDLHVMRQQVEEKVRGVLERQESSDEGEQPKRQSGKRKDLDQPRCRSLELENIQEEVLVRLRRCKLENFQEVSPPEDLKQNSPESSGFKQNLVEGSPAKVHTRKVAQWRMDPQASRRPIQELSDTVISNQPCPYQPSTWTRTDGQEPDQCAHHMEQSEDREIATRRIRRATDASCFCGPSGAKDATWNVFLLLTDRFFRPCMRGRNSAPHLPAPHNGAADAPEKCIRCLRCAPPLPTEPPSLRRIGSGSMAPRLRLGSSGVTTDLLFSRRMSGNCMSAHSSGFYETSDLDSTSSSCSSLCSDISCHTSVSLMSPHRSSVMRPRSIDCSLERRKELQGGMAPAKRPMSAGALDGYFLRSSSRFDLAQAYDVSPCEYPFSGTPPLCAIQQRRKTERYICKLALKFRCKPGGSNVRPDLGPPTPRHHAQPYHVPVSHVSCPSSPQATSLSSSLVDVRKHSAGSWGRFLSRVMLKKDSRIAASELNLEQYGKRSQDPLQSQSMAEGPLLRAKSFRDLLSVNPFKKSQRGLNKVW
ncbi:unnamed protein product [Ranitomeya imitator]|uniref:Uncharacterized protein n=1 Tax=Ranitomeya imitator TaxID=111125 RepID=A0ABN9LCA1_9NEOB|nr:unnamed protein product [Ranitomeya imitator]